MELAWGPAGARAAAARGRLVVVVDVLSFSTAVVTAVARGAAVLPCAPGEDARALAERAGAELAVRRGQAGFSLSPTSFLAADPGARVVLPSPNGSACSRCGGTVLAGALVNASAAAAAARGPTTVVASGETTRDGGRRFALEDYLGAGAVLAAWPGPRTPEAEACARFFAAARACAARLVRECASGRELIERGYAADVEHAVRIDAYDVAPLLTGGAFA